MNTSKKELKRIAAICSLEFSDEEYDSLQLSLETTMQEAQVLFQSDDCDAEIVNNKTIDYENLAEIAKKNFSFCIPQRKNTTN